MIDLSITKDPEWIKRRETLWKPVGESLSEGLRKKEVEKIHHYFMTGSLREGDELSDGAKFYWFPIQTPQAWDYIFEHMFDTKNAASEYESIFYFQFGDMAGRALDANQELALWDYFAGDEFRQEVTSRVPVGKEAKMVSFSVDREKIGSLVCGSVNSWLKGGYSNDPKWIKRSDYYFSFIENLKDEEFIPNDRGSPVSNGAYFVKALMSHMYSFNPAQNMDEEGIKVRIEFLQSARARLAKMDMPPRMKDLWKQFEL